MPKGPLLPRRANLRGAATGSQMGVRHGAMNPAGKYAATCGLIKVGQWFHSNSKYCLGDKGREQFLQRNCLDRGGLSRWFLGAGSSGNPTPLRKDRLALGERCVSLGPVWVRPHRTRRQAMRLARSRLTAVVPNAATHAQHEIRCCRGPQSTNAHSR
jgi:hypothetical protein